MRIATIKTNQGEKAAIRTNSGFIPISAINTQHNKKWAVDLWSILQLEQLPEINNWYRTGGKELLEGTSEGAINNENVHFGPLYRHPSKIWGIGLNYVEHAGDLSEKAPTLAPASFAKFDTTLIGPGDEICIPLQSERTTAEAELGIVFGKKCKDVDEANWLDVVAGFTTLLDMTAEDLLAPNPRYLTRSKNFDTFFSFGPELITPDEIEDVLKLNVATVLNSNIYAQNKVSNMTFPPPFLVSFHTKVATMLPGDIICTGTPRAAKINDGDIAECRIDGFMPLINPVVDLKKRK